jgi:hypothetical protein
MAEQTRRDEQMPNRASDMEKAEGSRDTAKGNIEHGGGISNRPLEAEQQEQESLPPRGQSKDKGHA